MYAMTHRLDSLVYPQPSMHLTELVIPLKLLEATASGRIVGASDVSGHREPIVDGSTGFLFHTGDHTALIGALRAAVAHRGRRSVVALATRKHVEQRHAIERLVEVYRHILTRIQERSVALEPAPTLAS